MRTGRGLAALLVWAAVGCQVSAAEDPPFPFELPGHVPAPRVDDPDLLAAEVVELGRHLFYDRRLSGPGTIACSSCHRPELAFADDRATSLGADGAAGTLNAPSLVNAIYASPLTWAHASIERIEDQLERPMFGDSPLEMAMGGHEDEIIARLGQDPLYPRLFEAAFPGRGLDLDDGKLALAGFVQSLVSFDSAFDAHLAGQPDALSEGARRGSELFFSERLGCGGCHAGFALTVAVTHVGVRAAQTSAFHNIGLYDLDGDGAYPADARGLIDDTGLSSDMGRFRVPSLRNVAVTAPYMHDGSVSSLEEVIRLYEDGGRLIEVGALAGDGRSSPLRSSLLRDFTLSAAERSDLIAFLESLTDHTVLAEPRHGDPLVPDAVSLDHGLPPDREP